MGTGGSWFGAAMNQNQSGMNAINSMYSGQMTDYLNTPSRGQALGNIAGQVLGGWAASGFKGLEGGGAVPEGGQGLPAPGPNDDVPALLTEGEYVIPKDVALRLGTEKLDKLVESTRQKAQGSNQNTPAGALPVPESPIQGDTAAPMPGYEGGGIVDIPPVDVVPVPIAPYIPPQAPPVEDPFGEALAQMRMEEEAQRRRPAAVNPDMFINTAENWKKGKGLPGVIKRAMGKGTAPAKGAKA